ncbi:MAG: hypothetical protein ACTS22_07680 [Phycisphaerales bacterium]
MFGYHKAGILLFGMVWLALVGGCGSGSGSARGSGGDRSGEGALLFGGGVAANPQDAESWSIGLMVFAGPDRAVLAEEAANELRSASSVLADAFASERGERSAVLLGRFASPSSREALEALERVRGLRLGGERPFRSAFFVPPTGGGAADLDLRTARSQYGADYSLQIGVYGRADAKPLTEQELREVRASAEEAARRLRREGELAFYYHGPSLSMVTVGVFTQRDMELGSAELSAARERFPHNLLNGQGIRQRVMTETGEQWVLQPSFPVAVPE